MKVTVKVLVEIGDADVTEAFDEYPDDLAAAIEGAIEMLNDEHGVSPDVTVDVELKEA